MPPTETYSRCQRFARLGRNDINPAPQVWALSAFDRTITADGSPAARWKCRIRAPPSTPGVAL